VATAPTGPPCSESAQVGAVRHNLRMPIQRWRCPVVLRVKAVVLAAAGVAVALVFFPLWLAVPVAALLGGYGLAMAALGSSVTLDTDAGLLRMRVGPVVQRIRLANVAAVLVDSSKISIKRVSGWEFSLYAWRKGRIDALLGVPAVAGDIGHAISAAAALAQAHAATDAAGADPGAPGTGPGEPGGTAGRGGTPARTRSRLATALIGVFGVAAIGCALVVRVHWQNPALTVLGVIIALALGVSGLFYLLLTLWILLTGRAPRFTLGS
jgi:hypothetical protein